MPLIAALPWSGTSSTKRTGDLLYVDMTKTLYDSHISLNDRAAFKVDKPVETFVWSDYVDMLEKAFNKFTKSAEDRGQVTTGASSYDHQV